MSSVQVNGTDLVADPSGALWWPERATLAVADLHFEKGSSFAARGAMLPPYDSFATLDRLEEVIARLRPERVVALGDSFHDRTAAARLPTAAAERLARLTGLCDWVWIAGNHDPEPRAGEARWGGRIEAELCIGALMFRHEAEPRSHAGEISGHFHPKATLHLPQRRISSRCFVSDGSRLVLPSFGAFTGGLDVFAPPIAGLFRRGFHAYLLARGRVLPVSRERLAAAA